MATQVAPVVCVHGFGVSSCYFVRAAERLAVDFDVFVPDLPGHGRSDTPTRALDVPGLADALIAWMDGIGLRRASFVANSMGCQVAVDAAYRYPGRCDRLVLVGPTMDPTSRSLAENAKRLLTGAFFEKPSLLPLLVMDYGRMLPRLPAEYRHMVADSIDRKLPHLHLPLLVVRGQHDPIASREWTRTVANLAGSGQVVEIPRWGHAIHHSVADRFVAAIKPFLKGQADSIG